MTTQLTDEQAKAIGLRVKTALRRAGILDELLLHRGVVNGVGGHRGLTSTDWWPDLRDGASRGALLELLREWHGEPTLTVGPWADMEGDPTRWCWYTLHGASSGRIGPRFRVWEYEPEAYAALCEVPRGQL